MSVIKLNAFLLRKPAYALSAVEIACASSKASKSVLALQA